MSDYLLIISGVVLIIAGVGGCFLPILPGPPLSFIAIVLLHLSKFGQFSAMTLILLGGLAVIVTIIDFAIPAWGTKKYGGSQYGVRGAAIGIIAGLFLSPIGIIIGPLLGAFIGEMMFKNDVRYALRAAVGSFIGFLTGVGLKFAASTIMTFMFFRELIRYF
ncbi:MAG: DUF456 domain-containing protein [Bacteroidales bacterium]|jgi:uncharacterized protein YqgC (DUF456 family)|nr:DUF456 domain-containing protein [Bacteroidales bacterium]